MCNLPKTIIFLNEINIYDFTFINNPKPPVSKCFDIEFIFVLNDPHTLNGEEIYSPDPLKISANKAPEKDGWS